MVDGYLYVAQNEYHSDSVLKIGRTEREPAVRMEELSGHTGVLGSYRLQFCILANSAQALEQSVHGALAEYKISYLREVFRIELSQAIALILEQHHAGNHVFRFAINIGQKSGLYT